MNPRPLLAGLLDDPVTRCLLTEALDEKTALLEAMNKAAPDDAKIKADLMTCWGLQAWLFASEKRHV